MTISDRAGFDRSTGASPASLPPVVDPTVEVPKGRARLPWQCVVAVALVPVMVVAMSVQLLGGASTIFSVIEVSVCMLSVAMASWGLDSQKRKLSSPAR